MKVTNIVRVTGRGYIVCCDDKTGVVMHIGDEVEIGPCGFTITGIEMMSHQKSCGLILSPNHLVKEMVHIGDEVFVLNDDSDEED